MFHTWFFKQFKSARNILNLPNCLTILRIALIPSMGFFLAIEGAPPPFELDGMFRYSPGKVATVILFIAGMTDLLDGWLARKWQIESLLGKFLDPVADKLVLLVGLVMLLKLGRVSEWLVILLLSREFLITGLRSVAIGEGLVIAAGSSGKLKQVFQLLGIGCLMWYGTFLTVPSGFIGTWILYAALGISLFSGFRYLQDFFTALRGRG